jgi:hypothetical protein
MSGPVALLAVAIAALALGAFAAWRYSRLFPSVSSEAVRLTPDVRAHLVRLRAEAKFGPDADYTGAATPADRDVASAAIDEVIDKVLDARSDVIQAKIVSAWIGQAMHKVDRLETEDRDRTSGYLIKVWYIIGFKGATGRFAYGSGFPIPKGHGEPLPPGWSAPDRPRSID